MNWIKTAIFSLIAGCGIGFVASFLLVMAGDCGIGAGAKAIVFGVPVGNVVGVAIYRRFVLNLLMNTEIPAGVLALLLSALAAYGGLHAMDVMGGMPGLLLALVGSCLASLVGYGVGLKIMRR